MEALILKKSIIHVKFENFVIASFQIIVKLVLLLLSKHVLLI